MKRKLATVKWFIFGDLLIVIIFPITAAVLTVYLKLPFLYSTLLFFGAPLVYLLLRNPHLIRKALASVAITVPVAIILSYFAIRDLAWYDSSIFSFRFINGMPLEDFVWFALWFTYIIIFYEFFVDRHKDSKGARINKRYKNFLISWLLALALFFILYVFFEQYLHIPYFYLIFTVVLGIVPLALVLYKRHGLTYKFSKVAVYFFAVNLLHEYAAQSAGHWVFPGHNFIGWVEMLGMSFPVEELIMWMILGSVFSLSWFEYFIDDFA